MMIEPHFYTMDGLWDLKKESFLLKTLHQENEILIIGDRSNLSDSWLIYLLGYLRGTAPPFKRLVFFLHGNTRGLPHWLREFPVVKSIPSLLRVWKINQEEWRKQVDKDIAEKRIKEMGYYLTVSDFFLSVEEGDLFLYSLYLEAGFSPDAEDKDGVPILCHIIRSGFSLFIPRLISRKVNINKVAHDRANTPVMEAASKGLNDVVRMLIHEGAELDHVSKSGQTALILAVGNGQLETAKILIEAGADPTPADELGMSAMKYAKLYGYQDLVEQIERLSS